MIEITKSFGKHTVLSSACAEIEPCRFYLIVGENGSGKTTLFKTLNGLIRRFEGTTGGKKYILVEDTPAFFKTRSGDDNLRYFLNKEEYLRSRKYVQDFHMEDYIDTKFKTYSQGMRKKLAVVLGLSKNADVLLLDEPSNGLDRNSVFTLHSVLKEYKKEKTVIVASHDASFFDPELVDRILVLKDRKIEEYRDDLFDYSYYFVRTKNELTADAAMIARRPGPDSYVVKVMPGEEDKAAASLIPFGLLEYRKLDYADSFYSENLL